MHDYIDIVFEQKDPNSPELVFVEVEGGPANTSLTFGTWITRPRLWGHAGDSELDDMQGSGPTPTVIEHVLRITPEDLRAILGVPGSVIKPLPLSEGEQEVLAERSQVATEGGNMRNLEQVLPLPDDAPEVQQWLAKQREISSQQPDVPGGTKPVTYAEAGMEDLPDRWVSRPEPPRRRWWRFWERQVG